MLWMVSARVFVYSIRATYGKHGGSVQMGEGGGRGGIRQVIGGHVDGLNGGDRTLLGGANTLLQSTHIGGKSGLVAYGGRDAHHNQEELAEG